MRTLTGYFMSKEDVKEYLSYIKRQYPSWGFDAITGGESEFASLKDYYELKKWFERKYK